MPSQSLLPRTMLFHCPRLGSDRQTTTLRVTKKCTRDGFTLHVPRHPNHDSTGYDCSLGTSGKAPHRHRGAATAAAATVVVVVGTGDTESPRPILVNQWRRCFIRELPSGQRKITARPHSPFAATAVAATAVAVRKDDRSDDDISTRIPRL